MVLASTKFKSSASVTITPTRLLHTNACINTFIIIPLRTFFIRICICATLTKHTTRFIIVVSLNKYTINQWDNRTIQFINIRPIFLTNLINKTTPIKFSYQVTEQIKVSKRIKLNNIVLLRIYIGVIRLRKTLTWLPFVYH